MNCPQCQACNPPKARFCSGCGATLAATTAQGHTVGIPATAAAPAQGASLVSEEKLKTIVARAEHAVAPGAVCVPWRPCPETLDQREHTVFCLDISSSMHEPYRGGLTKLDGAKRANINMVLRKAQIDPNDEVALVTFRSRAQIVLSLCPLHSYRRNMIEAIQSLVPDNGTDLNEGLKASRDTFDWTRDDIVRRIILLTDGHGGAPLRTAEDLKSRGVIIDVTGIGDCEQNVNAKLLRKVASVVQGESRYQFIRDQKTLDTRYTQMANKTATNA